MTDRHDAIVAEIQRYARAIQRETGRTVSFREMYHCAEAGEAVDASVYVHMDDGLVEWYGSSAPLVSSQITLAEMRDELGEWLVNYRKQEAAA